jgi:hypothetical protein
VIEVQGLTGPFSRSGDGGAPSRRSGARPRQRLAALVELFRCATLAANSHNTQPWRFSFGDGYGGAMPPSLRRPAPAVLA